MAARGCGGCVLIASLCFAVVCAKSGADADNQSGCTSDLDCSLNGQCESGVCRCDAAWERADCSGLRLLPSEPVDAMPPAYGYAPNVTSWGGNAILHTDGQYHLFVSEISDDHGNFCGLHEWGSHSRVVHAVSSAALGPYTRHDVALPQEAHNASPLKGHDGMWYLFHIGSGTSGHVSNCSQPAAASLRVDAAHSRGGSSFLHRAPGPTGPWTGLPNLRCNNPAPAQHPNGTFFVVCHNDGGFELFRSVDPALQPDGGWQHVMSIPIASGWGCGPSPYLKCEDPFLWIDQRGRWHFLSHNFDYRDGVPANANETLPMLVSGLGFSMDGLDWRFAPQQPYGSYVNYTDGSFRMFATMERPHLMFDRLSGAPLYLVNGVSPTWPCDACESRPGSAHSCVVCKTSTGVDWTYTLVRAVTSTTPMGSTTALGHI